MVELPEHPWYVGCQFHPEFTSTARDGHPLFEAFVRAAILHRDHRSGARDGASIDSDQATPPGAGNGSRAGSAAGEMAEPASDRANVAEPVH